MLNSEHRSHQDQLVAAALGVCWHSPTSDRWACTATEPGECICEHYVPEWGPHDKSCPTRWGVKT